MSQTKWTKLIRLTLIYLPSLMTMVKKKERRKMRRKRRRIWWKNGKKIKRALRTNEGEMLASRRALSNLKGAKDKQRKNTFHTRCTVKGKVCSLVINGGSCANGISLSMIEKLNLQASAHPHPYNIEWLSQGQGLQVNSRCLISFSIGKNYHDEL